MKIGLVGCTKSKLDHAAPARELYSPSTLFRGRVRYVEESCDRWFVLSAKHHVVDPGDDVDPYDVTLVGAPASTKRKWSIIVLRELERTLGNLGKHEFEVHAGHDYWGFGLLEGLQGRGAKLDVPTRGLGGRTTGFLRW